jgi:DNA-binding response OmpR family regulator
MKRKSKMHVLYVEDNEDSSELVRFMFGLSDIDVMVTKTAEEAWVLAQGLPFDLFLLDGQLLDGNTFKLCNDLHMYAPATPILFYTALAYQADIKHGMDAGANGYLVKPFFGDLSETVLQTIRDASTAKERPNNVRKESEDVMIFDRTRPIQPFLGGAKPLETPAAAQI